jgi:hypothetical protein
MLCHRVLAVPSRAPGSASVHTFHAVHGVTALARGLRIGLFLCETPSEGDGDAIADPAPRDLTYLVQPVIDQLAFFARTISLLVAYNIPKRMIVRR